MPLDSIKSAAYVPWYRLAEEVFGDLIPHLSNEEICRLTPKKANWFPIPLSSETEIKEVANRPQPHIDFKLLDKSKIRIGMRCNTVSSVDKMMNILDEMQTLERAEFIGELRQLSNDFKTQVLNKIKETNFAHVDKYDCLLKVQSNRIDDDLVHDIFSKVRTIREEGKRRLEEEHLSLNPETPVLDIIFTIIKQDPVVFKDKLSQIKKMYLICLNVKTSSELKTQKKRLQQSENQWVIKLKCSKCGKEFSPNSFRGIGFCDEDGMRLIGVKERKQ